MPYVDSTWGGPFNGTEAQPYAAVPADRFTTGVWYIKAGTTLALAAEHYLDNNLTIGRYGTGANPIITRTGNAMPAYNYSNVLIENLNIRGTGTGIGIIAQGVTNFIIQDCTIHNFETAISANNSTSLTIQRNTFTGTSGTFGIKSQTLSGDVASLVITGNIFTGIGTAIWLIASDPSNTIGKYTGLSITNNTFTTINDSCIRVVGGANVNEVGAETKDVTGVSTIVSSVAWPVPWTAGQKIFLAGYTFPANFGLFTVASVSGTTLTVAETSLNAAETAGTFKGAYLIDATRAYISPTITGNIMSTIGGTPIDVSNFIGGTISNNSIYNSTFISATSAGIEIQAASNVTVDRNYVSEINGDTFDGMGIFFDGGCDSCTASYNVITDLNSATADNGSAGFAVFYSTGCSITKNNVVACYRGIWAGGTGGTGHVVTGNTFNHCTIGIAVNSSPPASTYTFSGNLITSCTAGLRDSSAGQTITGNTFVSNATNDTGAHPDVAPLLKQRTTSVLTCGTGV
jgi:hypothetical protein